MAGPFSFDITTQSPKASARLGQALAVHLKPGHVVLLSGPIGAGKSHIARAILRDLGVSEDIPSPTFTLVQTYHVEALEIWHADLYRLSHVDEVAELGLLDAFETSVVLIEWPDLLVNELPKAALSISISLGSDENTRQIHFRSADSQWLPVFDDISAEVVA